MAPTGRKAAVKPAITVVILEDNETMAKGMCLEMDKPDIRVCGVATQVEDFLALVKSHKPNVAIVDLGIPPDREAGFAAIEKAKPLSPGTKFVVHTIYDEPENFHRAIKAGVKGFVTKNIYETSIDKVVRIIADGGNYFGDMLPQYLKILKEDPFTVRRGDTAELSHQAVLSRQEIEVLRLSGEGLSKEEVAARLTISLNTVKAHTKHIREKLGVNTTQEAIRIARLRGMI
jgi:DNA-binding NarL/FixJ family response regulator